MTTKEGIYNNITHVTITPIFKKNIFEINIIPHTLKLTNLVKLKKNDKVNIEFDIFSKYFLNLNN